MTNQKNAIKQLRIGKRPSFTAGACAAGVFMAGSLTAGATTIAISNFSFETSQSTGASIPSSWSGGSAYRDTNGTQLSTANGTGGDSNTYLTLGATAGTNSPITQNTAYVAQLGDIFTLTVGIGNRNTYNSDDTADQYFGTISLLINGSVVASNTAATTGAPPNFGFANATVTYTALAGDVGKTVGVQLRSLNDSAVNARREFDNIRLDVVPEPSTFVLAGGAALLGLFCRRRTT